jgi:hypothetical protein
MRKVVKTTARILRKIARPVLARALKTGLARL